VIVVDTNVIIALYASASPRSRLLAVVQADGDLRAPPLWRSECRNVLIGAVRRGEMDLAGAMRWFSHAARHVTAVEVEAEQVLRLAHQSGCTAYDCEFVALALELGAPLYTFDKKLLAAFPEIARSP
jgi:predicted nucleic acid-binding protein